MVCTHLHLWKRPIRPLDKFHSQDCFCFLREGICAPSLDEPLQSNPIPVSPRNYAEWGAKGWPLSSSQTGTIFCHISSFQGRLGVISHLSSDALFLKAGPSAHNLTHKDNASRLPRVFKSLESSSKTKHRILLSNQKEQTTDTRNSTYKYHRFYVNWKKRDSYSDMVPFFWHSGKVKTIGSTNRSVVTRSWRWGKGWTTEGSLRELGNNENMY